MASGDMNTSQPVPSEFEPYLSDAAKLRRLARGLIDDMHVVEDAVHAALAASAHRQYRDEAHRSRSLWASVRNAINDHRRSTANRVARERVAARPEALPAADDSTIRIETSKLVLEELGQLDERYRSVLTRHYLQDLSPKAIATQDGVDLNTVHRRIQRGRELLRERLERRAGGRENLLGLLIPFVGAPRAGLLRGLRSTASSSPAAWAAAVIVSLGLGLLLWFTPEVIELSTAAAPASGPSLASATEARAQESHNASRTAVESHERVELRVVTGSGAQRVADAAVTWWPLPQHPTAAKEVEYWFQNNILEERVRDGAVEHIADANGVAQLPWSSNGFVAIASKGSLWGYTVVPASHRGPVLLEVVEDSDFDVFVRDPEGRPLEGMIVAFGVVFSNYEKNSLVPDEVTGKLLRTTTGQSGRAKLRHIAALRRRSTDPTTTMAQLIVGAVGRPSARRYDLALQELGSRVLNVEWTSPLTTLDIEVEGAPAGYALHPCCFGGGGEMAEDVWSHLVTFDGRCRIAADMDFAEKLKWRPFELELVSPRSLAEIGEPGDRVHLRFAAVPARADLGDCTVAAQLVDANGVPLVDRTVTLVRTHELATDEVVATARTSSTGAFELRIRGVGDPDSLHCLLLSPSANGVGAESLVELVPSAAARHELGVLQSSKLGAVVSGTIVDERGAPVSGAFVRVVRGDLISSRVDGQSAEFAFTEVISTAGGAFVAPMELDPEDMVAPKLTIVATSDGHGDGFTTVGSDLSGLKVKLGVGATVRGRVQLDPSIPTSSVWVFASPFKHETECDQGGVHRLGSATRFAARTQSVDPDGRFELTGLASAPLHLSVLYFGDQARFHDSAVTLHTERLDATEESIDIDLRRAFHRCVLQFKDALSGAPAAGVSIRLYRDSDGFGGRVSSDSAGRASLLVPTGLKAFVESLEYYNDELDLEQTDLTVELSRPRLLTFQVEAGLPALDPPLRFGVLVSPVDCLMPSSRRSVPIDGDSRAVLSGAGRPRALAQVVIGVWSDNSSSWVGCGDEVTFEVDLEPDSVHLLRLPTPGQIQAALEQARQR